MWFALLYFAGCPRVGPPVSALPVAPLPPAPIACVPVPAGVTRAGLPMALRAEAACGEGTDLGALSPRSLQLGADLAVAELVEAGPPCTLRLAWGHQEGVSLPRMEAVGLRIVDASTVEGRLRFSWAEQIREATNPLPPGAMGSGIAMLAVSQEGMPRRSVEVPLVLDAAIGADGLTFQGRAPELCRTLVGAGLSPHPAGVRFRDAGWSLSVGDKPLLRCVMCGERLLRYPLEVCPPGGRCTTYPAARVLAAGTRWRVEDAEGVELLGLEWAAGDAGTLKIDDAERTFTARFTPPNVRLNADMHHDELWNDLNEPEPAARAAPGPARGNGWRLDDAGRAWIGDRFVPGVFEAWPLDCDDDEPGAVLTTFVDLDLAGVPAIAKDGAALWVDDARQPCLARSKARKVHIQAYADASSQAPAPRAAAAGWFEWSWDHRCLVDGLVGAVWSRGGDVHADPVVCVRPPGGITGVIDEHLQVLGRVEAAIQREGGPPDFWRADQLRFYKRVAQVFTDRLGGVGAIAE